MSLKEAANFIEKHVITYNGSDSVKRKKVNFLYYIGVCVTVPVKVFAPPK